MYDFVTFKCFHLLKSIKYKRGICKSWFPLCVLTQSSPAFATPRAFNRPMNALRAFTLRLFYFPRVLLLHVVLCVPPCVIFKVKKIEILAPLTRLTDNFGTKIYLTTGLETVSKFLIPHHLHLRRGRGVPAVFAET